MEGKGGSTGSEEMERKSKGVRESKGSEGKGVKGKWKEVKGNQTGMKDIGS